MTYGPVTGDTGSPQPPPARVGLLIGLVAVLLVICGGIAFTGYRFVGTGTGDRAAADGPRWDPPVRTPAPGPPTPTRPGSAASSAPSPTPATTASVTPAQGSLVSFGATHVVEWPDHLQVVVPRARTFDLPAQLAGDHPGDIEVLIELYVTNNTSRDVALTQTAVQLLYGPHRQPAGQYVDKADNLGGGVYMTIWPGHRENGDFLFLVPANEIDQLVFEIRPRPGDATARFYGSAA